MDAKLEPTVAHQLDSSMPQEPINGEQLEQFTSPIRCFNCGHESTGNYCSACGQKKVVNRISIGTLFKDLWTHFFMLDRGFVATFLNMFARPGKLARNFVYGQRKKSINPFAYFLIGASAQLFSLLFVSEILKREFVEQLSKSPIASNENLKEALGTDDIPLALADLYLISITQSYTYAALLFLVFPLAVLLWLSHKYLANSKYRFSETLVFSLFVCGHLLIVTSVVVPLALCFMPQWASLFGPTIYLLFVIHAHQGFYSKSWSARFLTAASMIVAMLIFFVSILLTFIITILVTAIFF